jgi:hypothetical protein
VDYANGRFQSCWGGTGTYCSVEFDGHGWEQRANFAFMDSFDRDGRNNQPVPDRALPGNWLQ